MKNAFQDKSSPITPTLAQDVDTLFASLGVVTDPGKPAQAYDAAVQALITTHNKLIALKDALAAQAARQRDVDERQAAMDAELNAREARLNALDLLTGQVIGFEQKPEQVRKPWFRRG
jgi:hypothetical protein